MLTFSLTVCCVFMLLCGVVFDARACFGARDAPETHKRNQQNLLLSSSFFLSSLQPLVLTPTLELASSRGRDGAAAGLGERRACGCGCGKGRRQESPAPLLLDLSLPKRNTNKQKTTVLNTWPSWPAAQGRRRRRRRRRRRPVSENKPAPIACSRFNRCNTNETLLVLNCSCAVWRARERQTREPRAL